MKGRPRYYEVFQALRQSLLNRGRMPTEKEILHELGMKRGTLIRILAGLVKRGALSKQPNGTLRYKFTPNSRVEPSPASAEREKAAPARDSSAGAAASVDPHREWGWMA